VPWTTDDLVDAVRRQAFMPDVADLVDSTRAQFTDAELLAIGTEELQSSFAHLVRGQRDDLRTAYFDTAIGTTPQRISLPERAMVRAVRRVHYVDTNGRESYEIEELPPADAHRFTGEFGAIGTRSGWYFEGDELVFPALPSEGSVRVYYQRALPRLVEVSDCAKIKSIAGYSITTDDPRPTWVVVGEITDIVKGSSPFTTIGTDLEVLGTAGTDEIELDPFDVAACSQPGNLVTKRFDYVCRAGATCYPPIPQEWHAALASCITVRVLEALGDTQAAMLASSGRDRRIAAAVAAATPRNAGRGQRIVNRSSALRSPRRWGR
jgi:hypothetical protein